MTTVDYKNNNKEVWKNENENIRGKHKATTIISYNYFSVKIFIIAKSKKIIELWLVTTTNKIQNNNKQFKRR